MSKITFGVITRNEERRIEGCLSSAAWADEILVLDSHSTDRTVEICRGFTDKVYLNEFQSFPNQRNRALDLATGDWVLFVDADERVTPELAREVRQVVEWADSVVGEVGDGQRSTAAFERIELSSKPCRGVLPRRTPSLGDRVARTNANRCTDSGEGDLIVGYWIPRQNIIWGKWIKHGGWYPDYQLRLLRRDKARYDESRQVHELVILQGHAGHLASTFLHHNYETVGQFVRKQGFYCQYEADTLFRAGVKAKPWSPALQPARAIKRRLWDAQGYRDGGHGLLLSLLLGYYEFVVYSKLLRMGRSLP